MVHLASRTDRGHRCAATDSRPLVRRRVMRITSISVAFAMAVVPPVISAQTSETSLVKRLDGVEQAVRALEKQVADLNSLLRSALPPPPFVDVMPFEISIAGAPTKGAATAKIVLIEYSDFECPYCGRYAQG